MRDHEFKTEPFQYQMDGFLVSRTKKIFAYLMEQGTGKSKLLLDVTAFLFLRGEIDGLVVMAPAGVHRKQWPKQIENHLIDSIQRDVFVWGAGDEKRSTRVKQFGELLNFEGLAVFLVNYEAARTKGGMKALRSFLRSRRTMWACDEATKIKNPNAAVTKAVVAASSLARYRRILNGTLVTKGPLDVYAQFKFLDPQILGFGSFHSFKHRYADWDTGYGHGHKFQKLVGFKNMDELTKTISPHSFRVTKREALPNLPTKLYTVRSFQLTNEQWRIYKQLRDELQAELLDGKGRPRTTVTAALAITRIMRLQQIACGYVREDDSGLLVPFDENPRANELIEALENAPGKAVVWCRFKKDVDICMAALHSLDDPEMLKRGISTIGRFDGSVSNKDRDMVLESLQNGGSVRFLVGTPDVGKYGHDMYAADTCVYYSNAPDLDARAQSEDRLHRQGAVGRMIDGKNSVLYTDLIAEGTVDEWAVENITSKKDLASSVLDNLKRILS